MSEGLSAAPQQNVAIEQSVQNSVQNANIQQSLQNTVQQIQQAQILDLQSGKMSADNPVVTEFSQVGQQTTPSISESTVVNNTLPTTELGDLQALHINPDVLDMQTGKILPDNILAGSPADDSSKTMEVLPNNEPVNLESPSPDNASNLPNQHSFDKLNCPNEDLAGQCHAITRVPYNQKDVICSDGVTRTGVFPDFPHVFETQLSEGKLQASDFEQFNECNKKLKEAVNNDPELASNFTSEQLEQINDGLTPDGYTWHHSEDMGKMQLVDSNIHAKSHHLGGKSIWGGGSVCR